MYRLFQVFLAQTKQQEINNYNQKHSAYIKRTMKKSSNLKQNLDVNQRFSKQKPNKFKNNQSDRIQQVFKEERFKRVDHKSQQPITLAQQQVQSNLKIKNKRQPQLQQKQLPIRPLNSEKTLINQFPAQFENVELFQCTEGCGRKFKKAQLQKHAKACKKVFQQKRQKFQVKIIGDQAQKAKIKEQAKKTLNKKQTGKNLVQDKTKQIPQWKKDSQRLRSMLKGKKEEQKMPQELDDRISCPNCGRKFNQKAAERHIPICKNLKNK